MRSLVLNIRALMLNFQMYYMQKHCIFAKKCEEPVQCKSILQKFILFFGQNILTHKILFVPDNLMNPLLIFVINPIALRKAKIVHTVLAFLSAVRLN